MLVNRWVTFCTNVTVCIKYENFMNYMSIIKVAYINVLFSLLWSNPWNATYTPCDEPRYKARASYPANNKKKKKLQYNLYTLNRTLITWWFSLCPASIWNWDELIMGIHCWKDHVPGAWITNVVIHVYQILSPKDNVLVLRINIVPCVCLTDWNDEASEW